MTDFYLLYIPFWLNLYDSLSTGYTTQKTLYIPFWLNLYRRCGDA